MSLLSSGKRLICAIKARSFCAFWKMIAVKFAGEFSGVFVDFLDDQNVCELRFEVTTTHYHL
jgi:hypothetical protein